MAWMIVQGRPDEGLRFVGPFEEANQADAYGERWFGNDAFWSCVLEDPDKLATDTAAKEAHIRAALKAGAMADVEEGDGPGE